MGNTQLTSRLLIQDMQHHKKNKSVVENNILTQINKFLLNYVGNCKSTDIV